MQRPRWQALLACLLLCSSRVHADPGYYLLHPYDQAGQLGAELRYWNVMPRGGQPMAQWPELGLSYGINARWTTLLLASYEGPSLNQLALDTVQWQNEFRLSDPDAEQELVLHAQFTQAQGPGGGHLLQWGPVWQTEIGLARVNANLLLEHGYGAAAGPGTELKYQWQWAWPVRPGLHLGLRGFGELGNWRRWDPAGQQSHRIGPALMSSWPLGSHSLSLQAAWLWGKAYGQQGGMLSAQAKLLF